MRLSLIAIVAIQMLAAALGAQSPSASNKRVSEIHVVGVKDASLTDLAKALFGMEPGQPYDAGLVRLGLRRIVASDAFASANVFLEDKKNGVKLIIEVTPEEEIAEIVVHVSDPSQTSRFESMVPLFKHDRFSKELVKNAEKRMQEEAVQMGFPFARVTSQYRPMGQHQWRVSFDIQVGPGVVLDRLEIEGRPNLLPSELKELLNIKVGERFEKKRVEIGLENVQKYLLNRGYLSANAQIKGLQFEAQERVAVTLTINSGPLFIIHTQGNHSFPKSLLERIFLKDIRSEELQERVIMRTTSHLERFYRRHGFADVAIRISIAGDVLLIDITEGAPQWVSSFEFPGAQAFSKADLNAIARSVWQEEDSEATILSPPVRGDLNRLTGNRDKEAWPTYALDGLAFNEEYLEHAAKKLTQHYRNHGFLEAEVNYLAPIDLQDSRHKLVTFRVDEGIQTLIQSILLEPEEFLALSPRLDLKRFENTPLNLRQMDDTRAELETKAQNLGYPFARVETDIRRVPGKADISFRANLGPQITIHGIEVRGNETTDSRVIADYLNKLKGTLYSREAVSQARLKLLRLDLFSRVDVQLEDGADGQRNLVVEVKERARATAELGVGASLEDGPRVIGQLLYRNLFGWAVETRSRLQINYPAVFYDIPLFYSKDVADSLKSRFANESPLTRGLLYTEVEGSFSLVYPKIYRFPIDTSASLDLSAKRDIRPAFTLNRASLKLQTALEPVHAFHFGPEFELEYANFGCVLSNYRSGQNCGDYSVDMTRRLDGGRVQQLTLGVFASLDQRNDPVFPTQGFSARVSADVGLGQAQLTGQALELPRSIEYLKLVGNMTGYITLAPPVTFILNAKVGNVFNLAAGAYVPLFKRFYLGGTNTIRGFNEDQILPADVNVTTNDSQPTVSEGGNFYANLRSEIRFPLWKDFFGSVFFDVGELLDNPVNFTLPGLAAGTGVGIRYQTLVGILAVDLGIRLFDRARPVITDFPNALGIHFSIG